MAHATPKLSGELRQRTGSKYAIRLRRQGKLPAVIYGHGLDPAPIAVDAEQITHVLHDGAHLLEVSLDRKKSETCLIKDVQYDHLGDTVIHVDLARVDMSEEVEVWVPIDVVGQDSAPGLSEEGAFFQHPLTDLQVSCRADAIPDQITVDVSTLEANATLTVSDLTLPPGVKAVTDPDTTVATISVVSEEEYEAVEEAAAAGAATEEEPEVIAERGEEEQGAEGEAPAEEQEKSE